MRTGREEDKNRRRLQIAGSFISKEEEEKEEPLKAIKLCIVSREENACSISKIISNILHEGYIKPPRLREAKNSNGSLSCIACCRLKTA